MSEMQIDRHKELLKDYSNKLSRELNLTQLGTERGIPPEKMESLGTNMSRIITEACSLKGIDPQSLTFKTLNADDKKRNELYGNGDEVLAEADELGIAMSPDILIEWSSGTSEQQLEIAKTLPHELHHVWVSRNFPSYEGLRMKKIQENIDSFFENLSQKYGKTMTQDELEQEIEESPAHAIQEASRLEVAAQLFAKNYVENFFLPTIKNPLNRIKLATQSLLTYKLDFTYKDILRKKYAMVV